MQAFIHLRQLREGQYSVRAKAAGFKEFVVQNVDLIARDYRRLDISMEVGAVETAVEVTAGATLIETETARIADTKTAEMLKSIPLNTRGIWAFLSLSPGVLQAGTGSTIRFAGSRGNQSHWAIDGITFSDGVDETQIGPLANYIESYQEIKLDIANNTAEFGTIGQVTLISKSGTNEFHGNLFDYYVTPWFRARNPFAPARNTGVSHTPGGSAGGPVFIPKLYNGKDKTFFFFSFETGRGSPSTVLLNPTVPLAPWRTGDFSALPTPVRDPSTGQPFPGNRIPANRLNPTSLKLQERFYPTPEFRGYFCTQSRRTIGKTKSSRSRPQTTGPCAAITASTTRTRSTAGSPFRTFPCAHGRAICRLSDSTSSIATIGHSRSPIRTASRRP